MPAATTTTKQPDPPPLKIKCTDTKCSADLHYFRLTKKMKAQGVPPKCPDCNTELAKDEDMSGRDISRAEETFKRLRREYIRHHFWHVELDQKALNYAKRKGKTSLKEAVRRRLHTSVGAGTDAWDGRQTPKENNPIFYAQHATATCCRKCMEKWHNVSRDEPLEEKDLEYFARLVDLYLDERLPDLAEEGQKVPAIRKAAKTETKDGN